MLDFDVSDPTLRRELHALGQLIGAKETEQNWQSIDKAVAKLTTLFAQATQAQGQGNSLDAYVLSLFKFVKAKRSNLVAYLKTERTSFSGTVCKLVESIATHYAANQHSPDELFLEPLIALTSRTNKLFQQRSTAALLAIMASASSDLIVPKLTEAVKNKSGTTRLSITQCLKRLLEVDQARPDKLEPHTPSIEAALKLLTQDAVAQVRELARTTVALYMKMFPLRATLFLNTLTPAVRKALGGSASASATSTPAGSGTKAFTKRPPIPRLRPAPGASGPACPDVVIHAPPRPPPSAPMRTAATVAAAAASSHAPVASTRRISHPTGNAPPSSAAIRTLQSQSRAAASSAAVPHTPLLTIKSGASSTPAATSVSTPAPHASITLTQFLITSSSTSYTQRFHAFDSAALHLLPHALPLTADDNKLIARHLSHGLASTHPKPLAAALGNVATMVQRGVITGSALTKVVAKVAQLAHTAEYACRPTIMDPVHAILEAVGSGALPTDLVHVVGARAEMASTGTADAEASRAVVAALLARIVGRLGVVDASKAVLGASGEQAAAAVMDTLYQIIVDAGNDKMAQALLAKWVCVLEKGQVKVDNVKRLAEVADDELEVLIDCIFAPAEPEKPTVATGTAVCAPGATPKRTAQPLPPTTPGTVFREPGLPSSRMIGTPAPASAGPVHVSTPFSVAAAAAKSPALTATPLGIFSPAMPDVASVRKRTLTPGAMLDVAPVRVKRTRGESDEIGDQGDEGSNMSPTKKSKRARMESTDDDQQQDPMEVDPQPIAQPKADEVEPSVAMDVEPEADPSMLSPAVVDVTALLATAADLEAAGETGLDYVFQAALDDVNYDLMLLDRTPLTDLLVYLDKCSDLSDELIGALLHLIHAELASLLSSAVDDAGADPATPTPHAADGERRIRTLILLQQLLKQMSAAQLPTHIGEFLLGALFAPPTATQLGSLQSWDTAHHEHMLRSETQVFLCALLPVDRVLAVLAAHTQDAPVTVYALLMHLLERAPAAVLPRLAEWLLVYVLDAVVGSKGYRADAAAGFVSWVASTLGERGKAVVREAIRLAQEKKDAEWGSRLVERLELKGVQPGDGLVFTGSSGIEDVESKDAIENQGQEDAHPVMQMDESVVAEAT